MKNHKKIRKKGTQIILWKVLRVYDLDPIPSSGAPFMFRIEVLKQIDANRFRIRIWRTELYDIRPAEVTDDLLSQATLIVEDLNRKWEVITGSSENEVLAKAISEFQDIFYHCRFSFASHRNRGHKKMVAANRSGRKGQLLTKRENETALDD